MTWLKVSNTKYFLVFLCQLPRGGDDVANFPSVQFAFTKLVNPVDDIVSVDTPTIELLERARDSGRSSFSNGCQYSLQPQPWRAGRHGILFVCLPQLGTQTSPPLSTYHRTPPGLKAHSLVQPLKQERRLAQYISTVQTTYGMVFTTVRHRAIKYFEPIG
jgi:hypothetical protein